MAKLTKINHVAIAVENINAALEFWQDKLGLVLDHVEDVPSQSSKVAFMPIGESEIELVQPTESDTGLHKYLEKRGEGLHHLCIETDNIEEILNTLKEKGVRLINEEPLTLPGRKMAFIHPKSSNGVLIELYEVLD